MIRNDPENINYFIKNLMSKNGMEETLILSQIVSNWKSIFNQSFDEYCRPYKLKNKVLSIRVSSSAWKSEIKHREEQIIEKINNNIGQMVITELKVK